MRVAVVGARPVPDWMPSHALFLRLVEAAARFVRTLPPGAVVVSGGAAGVDTAARDSARARGLEVVEHVPDYAAHGKRAPLVRNAAIVDDCDELHAFPAPWSRGTWHAVRLAKAAGKMVTVHEVGACGA